MQWKIIEWKTNKTTYLWHRCSNKEKLCTWAKTKIKWWATRTTNWGCVDWISYNIFCKVCFFSEIAQLRLEFYFNGELILVRYVLRCYSKFWTSFRRDSDSLLSSLLFKCLLIKLWRSGKLNSPSTEEFWTGFAMLLSPLSLVSCLLNSNKNNNNYGKNYPIENSKTMKSTWMWLLRMWKASATSPSSN